LDFSTRPRRSGEVAIYGSGVLVPKIDPRSSSQLPAR
jgi:hypothetical protein